MATTTLQPLTSELRRIRLRIDKLLEYPSVMPVVQRLTGRVRRLPIDMYETQEHVVIKATIAGLRPEDVDVCVTGNVLVIKTESKERTDIKGMGSIKRERFCGPFERCVTLPTTVHVHKAQAMLRNSELVLRFPKADKKPVHIKVQTARQLKAH